MTEAEQLLRQILESGDVVGRDGVGRTVLQLAGDRATLERLMAFGADAAEGEENGDDEPYGGRCGAGLTRQPELVWILAALGRTSTYGICYCTETPDMVLTSSDESRKSRAGRPGFRD